jgi:ABC-type phosphate transport system auxiliary subunit
MRAEWRQARAALADQLAEAAEERTRLQSKRLPGARCYQIDLTLTGVGGSEEIQTLSAERSALTDEHRLMTAELSRLHSEGQRLPFRQPDGSEVPPQWFVEQMAALSPLQGQGEDGEDSRREGEW